MEVGTESDYATPVQLKQQERQAADGEDEERRVDPEAASSREAEWASLLIVEP